MGALFLVLALVGAADESAAAKAERFLTHCREGRFEQAAAMFDAKAAAALPAERLEAVWKQLGAQLGELKATGEPREQGAAGLGGVTIRCTFEKATLEAKFAFDPEGKVSGFRLAPPGAPPTGPPPYADPAKFAEEDVTVGAEGWPLTGTLARPKGVENAPLVVMLHGSGPHDRDETIGPNKPLRDLAQGLASRGIATLRFEKRTFAHRDRFAGSAGAGVTVDAEVVDDALAAVAKARTMEGIDPDRIFVLGHSLGGSLAPAVAARDGKLAGLILLAAAARPPDRTVLDQFDYLQANDPGQAEGIKAIRPQVEAVFARLRAGEAGAGERLLGAPAGYWTSWMDRDPSAEAAALGDLPLLILRGGRDYQVVEADMDLFRAALKDRPTATLKTYPGLNHLFLAGEGKSVPAEYEKPGHVDPAVVADIAAWVDGVK